MPSIEPTWHAVVEKEAARFARRVEASGVKVPVATTDALNVIKVPLEAGVLLPDELEITGSSIEGLLAKLSRGEWSAEQVTVRLPLSVGRCVAMHLEASCDADALLLPS